MPLHCTPIRVVLALRCGLMALVDGPKILFHFNACSNRGLPVNKFVHDENIKLFHRQLAETTDPEKRRVLLKLLAEEETKDNEQPPRRQRR
jgi:hypothetical protein